jgi:aryl carrier-like protein
MTKIDLVFAHLKKGKTITSWQAFELFRATRLADIVFKLRAKGFDITTIMLDGNGTRYAKYKLNRRNK